MKSELNTFQDVGKHLGHDYKKSSESNGSYIAVKGLVVKQNPIPKKPPKAPVKIV